MFDREQFKRVHDDRYAVCRANRLAVLDDPVHLVLGRGRLRKRAYRFACVCVWLLSRIYALPGRTLQEIQQPARSRIPRIAILVFQILQQRNHVQLAL